MNALALPLSFVGLPNWQVIRWITDHPVEVSLGGLGLLLAIWVVILLWSIRPVSLWREWKDK